jgi:hypothetical protein
MPMARRVANAQAVAVSLGAESSRRADMGSLRREMSMDVETGNG